MSDIDVTWCFPPARLCRMVAAIRDACPFLSGLIQATGSQPLQTFSRIRFPAQQLTMKTIHDQIMLLLFRNHHRLRESILLQ